MKIKEYISKEQIEKKIEEIANQINKDYEGKSIHMICVLKGASFFSIELALKIKANVRMDFIEVSSYEGTESTGEVELKKDIRDSIKGKDVLIVEDIIDTGTTINYLEEYFLSKKPNSLKICTLLDKPDRRIINANIHYKGFTIEDKFVVGYGLDINGDYRNLPYIGVVEE